MGIPVLFVTWDTATHSFSLFKSLKVTMCFFLVSSSSLVSVNLELVVNVTDFCGRFSLTTWGKAQSDVTTENGSPGACQRRTGPSRVHRLASSPELYGQYYVEFHLSTPTTNQNKEFSASSSSGRSVQEIKTEELRRVKEREEGLYKA